MHITQICLLFGFQQLESNTNGVNTSTQRANLYKEFHIAPFINDLTQYTGLTVSLLDLTANSLPDDAFFILFDSHLPDALFFLGKHSSTLSRL